MYSHGASSPALTSAESASTMCVCGEIGYAATTSGRQRATVSATAREPSSCLRMNGSRHMIPAVVGGCGVAFGEPLGEPLCDRRIERCTRDGGGHGGERTEERGAGQWPAEPAAR